MSGDSVPRPVVVSGPSGCGKSTILNRLFEEYPTAFGFSVSHTTRGPRPGEEDGKAYNFVTRDVMKNAIANDEFIEHAEFGGNMYGTSKAAVESVQRTGKICILDLELAGVRSVHASSLNARFVYVKPPSYEELEKRLRARNTETPESLQKRLDRAKTDMLIVEKEPSLFDSVVVNDDLESAYQAFKAILKNDLAKFA